jgi:hypothetical protein
MGQGKSALRTKSNVGQVFDGLWPRLEYREAVAIDAPVDDDAVGGQI